MQATTETTRADLLGWARWLQRFSIGWAAVEAMLGLWSAWATNSLSLAAFGFDSLIEMVSAVAILWRLRVDRDPERRDSAERKSLRVAAVCLLLLAAYVAADGIWRLVHRTAEHVTVVGVAVAASALIAMPLLARAKRRVAHELGSAAMATDARQADVCTLQALIVLVGLLVHRWFHVAGADAVAGLLLVPLIFREGVRALRGQSCGCAGGSCR